VVSEKIKEEITREKNEIKKESVKREAVEKLRMLLSKRIQTKESVEVEGTLKRKILGAIAKICGIVIASAAILLLAPVLASMTGIALTQVVSMFETLRGVGVIVSEGLANKSFVSMAVSIFSGPTAETILSGMPLAGGVVRGIASVISQKVTEGIATALGIRGATKSELGMIVEQAAEDSIKDVIQEYITEEIDEGVSDENRKR
jgi:hypothetical protein